MTGGLQVNSTFNVTHSVWASYPAAINNAYSNVHAADASSNLLIISETYPSSRSTGATSSP